MTKALLLLSIVLPCCTSSSSAVDAQFVVQNRFPATTPVGIVKVSYRGVVLQGNVIANGADSPAMVVSPGVDPAYALLAFGWSPGATLPARLVAVRTKDLQPAVAGTTTPVVFSFPSHFGKCAGMTKDEYTRVTASYFASDPVEDYDAVACPGLADSGADDAARD